MQQCSRLLLVKPSRRIGGLENAFFIARDRAAPSRRIGGLEMDERVISNAVWPSRRIGGLENRVDAGR